METIFITHLTLFKKTGKFYSEVEYLARFQKDRDDVSIHEIWDDIEEYLKQRNWRSEYFVTVLVPGHKDDHPRLIVPK